MQNVRDGDIGKLAVLFERHHVALFSYYFRLTRKRELSEDLVQEVFLRILKYRHTFRGDGQFTTWMYSIARNAHIDHHRKWNREQPIYHGNDDQEVDEIADSHHPDEREEGELLQRALTNLPEDKRELIILSRYQDLKYSAIGELLGCSEDAVKTRVHRAMKALKDEFFKLTGKGHR